MTVRKKALTKKALTKKTLTNLDLSPLSILVPLCSIIFSIVTFRFIETGDF
jgi:hypothetical protein